LVSDEKGKAVHEHLERNVFNKQPAELKTHRDFTMWAIKNCGNLN